MTRSLTRRAPMAALAVGALAMTACGGDDDDATVTAGEIEVTSPGSEEGRIELPGTAEAGQTASASATVATSVALSGPIDQEVAVTVRLDYTAEVTSADAEGYVMETEFTDSEAVDAPAGADLGALDDIVGVRYRQTFAADGTTDEGELVDPDSLTPAQMSAFEEFGGQVQSTTFAYPDEPVGVGATWVASTTVESQGLEIEVPYEYELTSVEGDDYEIAITYDTEVDEEMTFEGIDADVSGTISGGGTVSGSVANPLVTASSIEQDMDLDLDADGEVLSMVVGITVEVAEL